MNVTFFQPDDTMVKSISEKLAKDKLIIDMGCGNTAHFIQRLIANGHTKTLGFEPFIEMDDLVKLGVNGTKVIQAFSGDQIVQNLVSGIGHNAVIFLCRPCHHPGLIQSTIDLAQRNNVPLYYIGLEKNLFRDLIVNGNEFNKIEGIEGTSRDNEIILQLN